MMRGRLELGHVEEAGSSRLMRKAIQNGRRQNLRLAEGQGERLIELLSHTRNIP